MKGISSSGKLLDERCRGGIEGMGIIEGMVVVAVCLGRIDDRIHGVRIWIGWKNCTC